VLRFGVLGVSNFAVKKMIPAMRAARDVEVVAIASRDGHRAAEAAAALGIPRAADSYEALVADPEIDAIYNPLPNHLHVPWSERAAGAGKHVLCEKPVGLDAAEARRLLAARDAAGVLVCEAAMVRLHPRWAAVRDLLRGGKLGELRAFMGTFGYQLKSKDNVRYDKAAGGGALYDVGFYPVTMSRFCFEAEPVSVFALCDRDPERGVDRLSSAVLRFPTGHAVFTTGMEVLPVQRAQLVGTAGVLEMVNPWNAPGDQPTEIVLESSPAIETPAPQRIRFDAVDQYTVLLEAFATAVAAGARGNPGPVPLEDSIRNMAVLDALHRSAASGREELVAVER
jgi:predicted dehydrogenase